ncbi:winged helix-turn-helix domain-containing protein [Agromyces sp. 3263]|uniref:winged helix-turn-helix domain-containing protein n=1 Tax=Agromyces sp. 3263 TaxID=2817750 RepID=UPI0037C1B0D7
MREGPHGSDCTGWGSDDRRLPPAVLRYLAEGEVRSLQQIIQGVTDVLQLDDHVVAQKISSGQGRLENRACSSFYRAGLLERERRSWYWITEDGRAVADRGLTEYSEQDLLEWPTWRSCLARTPVCSGAVRRRWRVPRNSRGAPMPSMATRVCG